MYRWTRNPGIGQFLYEHITKGQWPFSEFSVARAPPREPYLSLTGRSNVTATNSCKINAASRNQSVARSDVWLIDTQP